MHILLINDDGPPSKISSPYIHAFCQTLQKNHHLVSVILPHEQRSWIGKAHFVGQVTKPSYFRPGTVHNDDGTTHPQPLTSNQSGEEWVLVNGTPATCAQLGLYHFFKDRPPVDLVISGPNYGRNCTSLFSLSSGTIGGAMEAAVCRKKAVALSFAFWSRDHDPEIIAATCRHAVKLIDYLYRNWGSDVDLYSCNVPVVIDVEKRKTVITNALQNYWTSGSSFEEIEPAQEDDDPQTREKEIRESCNDQSSIEKGTRQKHRHFKWAPKFGDIQKSIEASDEGNDGWAIHQKFTSVTPLKANYLHAGDIPLGELKLFDFTPETFPPKFFALVSADPYVTPLLYNALSKHFVETSYRLINSITELPDPTSPLLQILPYEALDFSHVLLHSTTSLANSYMIRKALIRKHYLHNTIQTWLTKHPHDDHLKEHVPLTVAFEVDYAEFLDEALAEAWELHESFGEEERQWWILKPGMSDQGQGVRLFSSGEELRGIFEEWEDEYGREEDGSTDTSPPVDGRDVSGIGTMTSQLRHFVAQKYIHPPLLLETHGNRKFHVRSYVLAVGALQVYVYGQMLALFASAPYTAPNAGSQDNPTSDGAFKMDSYVHLTNTCRQSGNPEGSVIRFVDLDLGSYLPKSWLSDTYDQICATTGTLFEAAAREQMVHFQTLENAFEIFGLDWMLDERGVPWLLEVNAFPDFKQTGEDLKDVIQGLMDGVVCIAVDGFFRFDKKMIENVGEEKFGLRMVLDVDLGRR